MTQKIPDEYKEFKPTPTERQEARQDKSATFHKLWRKVVGGLISTKEFKKATGKSVYIAGKNTYSKYTGADLRKIRKRNGVGGPPKGYIDNQGFQMNNLHWIWYLKKFGKAPS